MTKKYIITVQADETECSMIRLYLLSAAKSILKFLNVQEMSIEDYEG